MKKIGYFPGCSLHGTAVEYEESLQEVCKAFDIELIEIKDWNCCGATAAHSLNKVLSISLPIRNLALAEEQNFEDILVPCAACFSRLSMAQHELKFNEKLRKQIPSIIELNYNGTTKPLNVIDFIEKYILSELDSKIKVKIDKIVAAYYGCLLMRPKEIISYDRIEDPLSMEKILNKIGCKTIDWAFKTECCGAGLSVTRTDIVAKLSGNILDDAVSRGAEVIVAACPMCQSNLDMRRKNINEYLGHKDETPILFITQIIGLSLGLDPKKLGLSRHIVNTEAFVNSITNIKAEVA
jgi:heterodisulfide reductase subunit B